MKKTVWSAIAIGAIVVGVTAMGVRLIAAWSTVREYVCDLDELSDAWERCDDVHALALEKKLERSRSRAKELHLLEYESKMLSRQYRAERARVHWRMTEIVLKQPCLTPNPTLKRLKLVLSPSDPEYNPLHVICAINHLVELGKLKAVGDLRKCVSLDLDLGESLYVLLPILLNVNEIPSREPPFRAYLTPCEIVICDGIPICTVPPPRGFFRKFVNRGYLVDWADGEPFRMSRLRPSDQPLEAGDKLYAKLERSAEVQTFDAKHKCAIKQHIRVQTWRMIAHLVEPMQVLRSRAAGEENVSQHVPWQSEEEWTELKKKVGRMRIRWDEKTQEYILLEGKSPS
jgi:hypothetical protein